MRQTRRSFFRKLLAAPVAATLGVTATKTLPKPRHTLHKTMVAKETAGRSLSWGILQDNMIDSSLEAMEDMKQKLAEDFGPDWAMRFTCV